MAAEPFLRLPPFPRHRAAPLSAPSESTRATVTSEPAEIIAALRSERVGGSFWGAWPTLPPGRDILLAAEDGPQARHLIGTARADGVVDRCVLIGAPAWGRGAGVPVVKATPDPWHLAVTTQEVRSGAGHELALVAALLGRPLRVFGDGPFAEIGDRAPAAALETVIQHAVADHAWRDPFRRAPSDPLAIIAQLGGWRRLIDGNRPIAAIFGVAPWKQVTVDALLWAGSGKPPYRRGVRARGLGLDDRVLAWKSRTSPAVLATIEASGAQVGEIEDGFIRSSGLGANCVPPLSVIVDWTGIYFDPNGPSDLERILAEATIGEPLLARAAALRRRLVQAGISKYERDTGRIARSADSRRWVLVTGQVEDDRSVLSGGRGHTNLELLRKARMLEPDAWIIYKPHPDVEAGHRKGRIADCEVLRHADAIERSASIGPLIDSVDALHVITSQAGFEALLRHKPVTTHGVPFYAGWGLTRDLAPIPPRRGRARSLDELVAAALILYPRYLDPVTRLPCPVEVLVDRLAAGQALVSSPLVRFREAQGRLKSAAERFRIGTR